MTLKNKFLKAAAHSPMLKQLGADLADMLYGTMFSLQKGPKLTSDRLQMVSSNPDHDDNPWRNRISEKRQYVAKQNKDGTWDVQRITRMEARWRDQWTSCGMEAIRVHLEEVRAIFAQNNRIVSPTGQTIMLNNVYDEASCLSESGHLRTDYRLIQPGNYRQHPGWAPQSRAKQDQNLTP